MKHYVTVHRELKEQRGKASEHQCFCGAQAEQWAYQYTGGETGHYGDAVYSEDLLSYAPMCRKCHRRFDMDKDPRIRTVLTAQGARLGAITGALKSNVTRRRCDGCGMVSLPGPLGVHQRSSGHTGYRDL